MEQADPIIEKSAEQRDNRIARLILELNASGYCVVKSDWLQAILSQNKRKTLAGLQ